MTAIQLTISLPDDVAEEAEAAGLLSSEEISRLVQEEVLRQASDLDDDQLRRMVREALDDPRPLVPNAEVFARLRAHRELRRQA